MATLEGVVVFPDDYPLSRVDPHDRRMPKLIGGLVLEEIWRLSAAYTQERGRRFELLQTFLNDSWYFLSLSGFEMYHPHRKISAGSGAQYLAGCDSYAEYRQCFLLQKLVPNVVTSRHYHAAPEVEIFHSLAGEVTLRTDQETIMLTSGMSRGVQSGTIHQLATGSAGALTILEIHGRSRALSRENHIYA